MLSITKSPEAEVAPREHPEIRSAPALSVAGTVVLALTMLALFAASVFIRLPHMGRPLGEGHEWLTSTVVRNLMIWEEEGALKDRFLPIFTYPGKANKFINNQGSEHMDAAGNYYYTSYGPLAYVVPYLVLKALGQQVTVFGVQCFNLGVHLVAAVLVFVVAAHIIRPQRPMEFVPPLLAYAFYVFSAATLWLHSNVYMADMFVQPLWILCVLLVLRYSETAEPRWPHLAAICASVAATVMAEWIGVFFAAAVGAYALLQPDRRRYRGLLAAAATGVVVGVGSIVIHYSTINGLDGFAASSAAKFAVRSGLGSGSTYSIKSLESWIAIVRNYGVAYGVIPGAIILAVAVAVGVVAAKDWKRGVHTAMWRRAGIAFALLGGSIALHHLVFFDFTAVHFFAMLKTAVVFALVFCVAAYRALGSAGAEAASPSRKAMAAVVPVTVAIAAVSSVTTYERHAVDWRNDLYQRIGTAIAAESRPEECVFVRGHESEAAVYVGPQIVLYAHRNIASWESTSAAVELMRRQGVLRGIVFSLDPTAGVTGYERFVLRD